MKRILIIPAILLFLLSCEKSYFPEENAYRDPDLVGTWQGAYDDSSKTNVIVFTEKGYYGVANYIDNDIYTGYTGLDGIWHITQQIDAGNNEGIIYSRSTNSNFSHRGWENYEDYYFSHNKDTLFKKLQSSSQFYEYTKYRLQLIYEDGFWVGIENDSEQ